MSSTSSEPAAGRVAPGHGVRMRGVRFRYGGPRVAASDTFELAVEDLAIERGEAIACIGPSGSGKTTLVHLAAGILVPDAGAVTLGDTPIEALSDGERRRLRAREVGLVFQEFELLDYLDGRDNVLLPHRLAGAGRAELAAAAARAGALAASLGIEGVMGRPPRRMSQGQRQRVAIARALVTEPSLVLCDEPTGNLDPGSASDVLELLLKEARERGAALLMVTHDHTLLGRFDRVVDVRELAGDGR